MPGRNFASNQLLMAEDSLAVLQANAHELSIQLGVVSDSIHFDGMEPPECASHLEHVLALKGTLERAIGLIRAYEVARLSKVTIDQGGTA